MKGEQVNTIEGVRENIRKQREWDRWIEDLAFEGKSFDEIYRLIIEKKINENRNRKEK